MESSNLTCTLSCRELQHRKGTVFAELNKNRLSKTERTNGYSYTFPLNEETERQIHFFIAREKECCSFFRFDLVRDAAAKVLKLEIMGPDGVKPFIDEHLPI